MANQRRLHCFASAQEQTQGFLDTLLADSQNPETFPELAENIRHWSQHAPRTSLAHKLSFFNSPAFIKKLTSEKKLRSYLQDSLTYLYVRDPDLDLNQPDGDGKIDVFSGRPGSTVLLNIRQAAPRLIYRI